MQQFRDPNDSISLTAKVAVMVYGLIYIIILEILYHKINIGITTPTIMISHELLEKYLLFYVLLANFTLIYLHKLFIKTKHSKAIYLIKYLFLISLLITLIALTQKFLNNIFSMNPNAYQTFFLIWIPFAILVLLFLDRFNYLKNNTRVLYFITAVSFTVYGNYITLMNLNKSDSTIFSQIPLRNIFTITTAIIIILSFYLLFKFEIVANSKRLLSAALSSKERLTREKFINFRINITRARNYFLFIPLVSFIISLIFTLLMAHIDTLLLSQINSSQQTAALQASYGIPLNAFLLIISISIFGSLILYSLILIFYIELRFNISLREIAFDLFHFLPRQSLKTWAIYAVIILTVWSAPISVLTFIGSRGITSFNLEYFLMFFIPPLISVLIGFFTNSYFIAEMATYSNIENAIAQFIVSSLSRNHKAAVIISNNPIALSIAKYIIKSSEDISSQIKKARKKSYRPSYVENLTHRKVIYTTDLDAFITPKILKLKFANNILLISEKPWPKSTYVYNLPGLGKIYLVKLHVTFGDDYLVPILVVDNMTAREVLDAVGIVSADTVIAMPSDYEEYASIINSFEEYSKRVTLVIYVPHGFLAENFEKTNYVEPILSNFVVIKPQNNKNLQGDIDKSENNAVFIPLELKPYNLIKSPRYPVIIQPLLRALKPLYFLALEKLYETNPNLLNFISDQESNFEQFMTSIRYLLPPVIILGADKSTFYLIYELTKIISEFLREKGIDIYKFLKCRENIITLGSLSDDHKKLIPLALPIFVVDNREKIMKKPIHLIEPPKDIKIDKLYIERALNRYNIKYYYYIATFLRTLPLCAFSVYLIEGSTRPRTFIDLLIRAINEAYLDAIKRNILGSTFLILNLEDEEEILNSLESIITFYKTKIKLSEKDNEKKLPLIFVLEPSEKIETELYNFFYRFGSDILRNNDFNFPYYPTDSIFSKSELLAYRSASITKLFQIAKSANSNTKKIPFILYGCIANRPYTLYNLLNKLTNQQPDLAPSQKIFKFNLRYTHILPCFRFSQEKYTKEKFLLKTLLEIHDLVHVHENSEEFKTFTFRKILMGFPGDIKSIKELPRDPELRRFLNRFNINVKPMNIPCCNAAQCPLRDDIINPTQCMPSKSSMDNKLEKPSVQLFICSDGSDQAGTLRHILELLYGIPRSKKADTTDNNYIANLSYSFIRECINEENALIELHGVLEKTDVIEKYYPNALLISLMHPPHFENSSRYDYYKRLAQFIAHLYFTLGISENEKYIVFPRIIQRILAKVRTDNKECIFESLNSPELKKLIDITQKIHYIAFIKKNFYCDDNRCIIARRVYSTILAPIYLHFLLNQNYSEISNKIRDSFRNIINTIKNGVYHRLLILDLAKHTDDLLKILLEKAQILLSYISSSEYATDIDYKELNKNIKILLKKLKKKSTIALPDILNAHHVKNRLNKIIVDELSGDKSYKLGFYSIMTIKFNVNIIDYYIKGPSKEKLAVWLVEYYKMLKDLCNDKEKIVILTIIDFFLHLIAEKEKFAYSGLLLLTREESSRKSFIRTRYLNY